MEKIDLEFFVGKKILALEEITLESYYDSCGISGYLVEPKSEEDVLEKLKAKYGQGIGILQLDKSNVSYPRHYSTRALYLVYEESEENESH